MAVLTTPSTRLPTLDAVAATTLVVMWSSGFVGAALGTRFATADTLLAWRYLAAGGVLVVVAAVRRMRLSPGLLWRQGVLGLLCQSMYLGGVVTGVGLGVPAGTAALIAAAQPLLVATAAGRLLGEHTSRRQRSGLVLGLVGVALVVGGDAGAGEAPAWAYLLPVGGMLALSAGTVLERRWRPPESLLDALTVQTVVAAGFFVALAASADRLLPSAQPGFWWSVLWIVVLSHFGGYGAYLAVLRRSGATRVSTLLYLTPPTTTVWAFVMFADRPSAIALAGFAVCAGAVYLAATPRDSVSA